MWASIFVTVAGDFCSFTVPIVRGMPFIVARTASALVGGSWPARRCASPDA
jgi:hypothetical protein